MRYITYFRLRWRSTLLLNWHNRYKFRGNDAFVSDQNHFISGLDEPYGKRSTAEFRLPELCCGGHATLPSLIQVTVAFPGLRGRAFYANHTSSADHRLAYMAAFRDANQ